MTRTGGRGHRGVRIRGVDRPGTEAVLAAVAARYGERLDGRAPSLAAGLSGSLSAAALDPWAG